MIGIIDVIWATRLMTSLVVYQLGSGARDDVGSFWKFSGNSLMNTCLNQKTFFHGSLRVPPNSTSLPPKNKALLKGLLRDHCD